MLCASQFFIVFSQFEPKQAEKYSKGFKKWNEILRVLPMQFVNLTQEYSQGHSDR